MIRKIIEASVNSTPQISVRYTQDEVCPICGIYSPDGAVCSNCLKIHGLYKPKASYLEE